MSADKSGRQIGAALDTYTDFFAFDLPSLARWQELRQKT